MTDLLEAVVGSTAPVALKFENGGGPRGAEVETNEGGCGIFPKPEAVKCIRVQSFPKESSFSCRAWCRTAAEAVLKPTAFVITVVVPLSSNKAVAVSLVNDGKFMQLLHTGSGRSTGIGVKSHSAKFRGNEV
jgi:hypothetical protein